MKNIKISLFGSSIMEGLLGVETVADRYYSLLHKKLSERFPSVCFSIFNGAAGGWSTRELMQKFDEFVLQYSPDYCLVMFGANNNDLARPERCLAEGELELLMEEFQRKLPQNCQRIGVVLNPVISERHMTYRHPAWQEAFKVWKGLDEMLEEERNKARSFYKKYDYKVLDLSEIMRPDMEKFVCSDGIHLTNKGHKLFAEKLFDILQDSIIRNDKEGKLK